MGVVVQDNFIYMVGGVAHGGDNWAVWAYQPPVPVGVGYSPVLVGSAADLIGNLVNQKVPTAGLGNDGDPMSPNAPILGQFSSGPSVLTATPDQGSFFILLKLGDAQPGYTVSNIIIGCASVPLSN